MKASGNPDYTLRVLPKANHETFEARVENNKEMVALSGFVPAYFTTVEEWLARHIGSLRIST